VHRATARRGPRSLTHHELAFQILRVAFTVTVDETQLRSQLRWLEQSAIQPAPPETTVAYAVRRRDGAYEITRAGVPADLQFHRAGVLATLYAAVQRDALAAWPQHTAVHAVVGTFAGERFAVVGGSARERSRLAVALMSAGAELEGDDLALLGVDGLTTYPRPIRLDRHARLPAYVPARSELPFAGSPGTGQWALDLARAGHRWEVRSGPVARFVHFDLNDGGQTRVRELTQVGAMRALVAAADVPAAPAPAIQAMASMLGGARCRRLWLGDVEDVEKIWADMRSGR